MGFPFRFPQGNGTESSETSDSTCPEDATGEFPALSHEGLVGCSGHPARARKYPMEAMNLRRFPARQDPPLEWMVDFMGHPLTKWMMTGGTPMTQDTSKLV